MSWSLGAIRDDFCCTCNMLFFSQRLSTFSRQNALEISEKEGFLHLGRTAVGFGVISVLFRLHFAVYFADRIA